MNTTEVPGLAHQRIEQLLDANSFVEQGALAAPSVVCGYGTICSRLVFVYAQCGPVTVPHAAKIRDVYAAALKVGAPVVALLGADGVKVDEGLPVLEGYGLIFSAQAQASGVIPQLSVILGECMGTAAFGAGLSDYVFILGNSQLFLESPRTYLTPAQAETGLPTPVDGRLAHFSYPTEADCLAGVRALVDLLPANNLEEAPSAGPADSLNRTDESLNNILAPGEPFDMNTLLSRLADHNTFMEVQKGYGTEAVAGYLRLGGYTVGAVAVTQAWSPAAMEKALAIVRFCDAFSIPLLTVCDAGGYRNSPHSDALMIWLGAKLLQALAAADVPKVNLIVRHAWGGAYLLLNSKHIGADLTYAWPSAQLALMEPAAAQKIMGLSPDASIEAAAALGYIDGLVEPAQTRKHLIAAFGMLSGKRVYGPAKKHASLF